MSLTDERVEEFRRLYKLSYGSEISAADARAMALRLLELYRLLMRPMPENEDTLPPE